MVAVFETKPPRAFQRVISLVFGWGDTVIYVGNMLLGIAKYQPCPFSRKIWVASEEKLNRNLRFVSTRKIRQESAHSVLAGRYYRDGRETRRHPSLEEEDAASRRIQLAHFAAS